MCFSTTQRFLGGSTMKTRIWPGMLGAGGPGEQTQAFRVLTDKKKKICPMGPDNPTSPPNSPFKCWQTEQVEL